MWILVKIWLLLTLFTCSVKVIKIAIIGAGYSGLCSAKYALEDGHDVTVFEQTSNFGGTWFYTDQTGVDKYGVRIHTSLYEGLRINGPIETMGFTNFPATSNLPLNERTSYVSANVIYNYLENWVKTFNILKVIKFNHRVVLVNPFGKSGWELTYENLPKNATENAIFDAVLICVGHYSDPKYPNIPGAEFFKGKAIHSHDYRRAEYYRNKTVLIIGAGMSGTDIAYQISKTAKKVYFSSNKEHNRYHKFKENVELKGLVMQLTEAAVEFSDGNQEDITDIIYCTGYKYSFPFLSENCDIHLDINYVQDLYQHIININHPTMAFIGLPSAAFTPILFDIQARYYLKYLKGEMKLPNKTEMLVTTNEKMAKLFATGLTEKNAHRLDFRQEEFYTQLAEEAGIRAVPPFIYDLYRDVTLSRKLSPFDYRRIKYEILDDRTFTKKIVHSV